MKKLIIIVVLILFLAGCQRVKFPDAKNEQLTTVEEYNDLVRLGAGTEFNNYRFIDLRSRSQYTIEYVSNFHYKLNIEYKTKDDLEKIIEVIEKDNKAGFSVPIILLDSGLEDDNASTEVYNLLIEKGYLNCKDVLLGFQGLKDNYQRGYPYNIKDGSDCGCE